MDPNMMILDTLSPPASRLNFLRTVPLLAGLGEESLARVAADFRQKVYSPGDLIFRQEDTTCDFYIIMSGKVRIYRISPNGGETSINLFFPTDILGEFATIDSEPRSATAKAIGRCILLQMSQECFLHHMGQLPGLALAMTRLLTGKVRWTAAYAESVAQYDAAGRLLHTLLLYNERYGRVIEPGQRYILDLSLNQTDLASLIGARREWVNRLLQEWRRRGLIEYQAGKIIILDLPAVEHERDSRIEANVGGW